MQRLFAPWNATRLWALLFALSALIYFTGLGSPHAPTNGDEMVYIHIARMTSESGHWLPLQSELVGTRNTKPPLLIWQAMAAGDWGKDWTLAALRLPSVLYTLATTALLVFLTRRMTGHWRNAWIAGSFYLLCFSTFRYGRAYLTSAPETFWLALPMWWLLWKSLSRGDRPENVDANASDRVTPTWLTFTWMGVCMGLGAAYKSFALVAPAAAAVWCAVMVCQPRWSWPHALRLTTGVTWSALLGVGIFALWFVLDPDPSAVWQEFVVAENAGKMSGGQGYWHAAFFGAYPMWTQLLAYPANAGLLAVVALGLCALGVARGWRWTAWRGLPHAQRVLLAWLLVWLVVFTIPSQRSERYLIPAMPAFALMMALAWDRMHRAWFALTLLVLIPALIMIGRIAWVMFGMADASMSTPAFSILAVALAVAGILLCIAGLLRSNWTRASTLAAVLSVYASFTAMVAPLSGGNAQYPASVQLKLQGQSVAVPNGFTGQYERFHFLLHGARITPYDAEGRNTGALSPEMPRGERLEMLLGRFDAVVWLQDDPSEAGPSCQPRCTVLAQRWHVKSRHKDGEVTLDNLWHPEQWLFRREWLVSRLP